MIALFRAIARGTERDVRREAMSLLSALSRKLKELRRESALIQELLLENDEETELAQAADAALERDG